MGQTVDSDSRQSLTRDTGVPNARGYGTKDPRLTLPCINPLWHHQNASNQAQMKVETIWHYSPSMQTSHRVSHKLQESSIWPRLPSIEESLDLSQDAYRLQNIELSNVEQEVDRHIYTPSLPFERPIYRIRKKILLVRMRIPPQSRTLLTCAA